MADTMINDDIELTYSDEMKLMTPAELSSSLPDRSYEKWGVWNEDEHVTVLFSWQNGSGRRFAKLDTRSVAVKSEEYALRSVDGYRKDEFGEFEISGKTGYQFSYSYRVNLNTYKGKTVIFKSDKALYTIYTAVRSDCLENGEKMVDELIGSMSISG